MTKSEKRTWEMYGLDLHEDYKGNAELSHAVMRNKSKPKTELCSILDTNGKLVWSQDTYLRTWTEQFVKLIMYRLTV
jgi:hypothetical protein